MAGGAETQGRAGRSEVAGRVQGEVTAGTERTDTPSPVVLLELPGDGDISGEKEYREVEQIGCEKQDLFPFKLFVK